ncbi:MAG: 3-keto-5-aminohexanoate cleavage protein [Thiolinea sp.]
MVTLPSLMVAPNGARRTQADHPALPVTIPQLVECARHCHAAGADGLHAHVRDAGGRHVLDVGLYRELLAELAQQVPGLTVQVTSEAAGIYRAAEQQAVIRELRPAYVSVALREMLGEGADQQLVKAAREFYAWAAAEQVTIQHILYSAADVAAWFAQVQAGVVAVPEGTRAQQLWVLGRYRTDQESQPEDLQPFLQALAAADAGDTVDWAVCAFGVGETACLLEAARQGGRLRLGFENSLWHEDGSVARDNAERVARLRQQLQAAGIPGWQA